MIAFYFKQLCRDKDEVGQNPRLGKIWGLYLRCILGNGVKEYVGIICHFAVVRAADVYSLSRLLSHFNGTAMCLISGDADQSTNVLPFYSGVFMPKMVNFIKDYFLVFLLGAIFGKVVEMSGIAESIAKTIVNLIGAKKAILTVVLLGAILTYSGVSLFVAVFAIYPFANQLFQQANIPKRLIPGTIALGAFTFTMDALPGTPQIQNVIPTTFFGTNIYAAPFLGIIGAIFVLCMGLAYLEWRRRVAAKAGEGYAGFDQADLVAASTVVDAKNNGSVGRQLLAFVPLILVAVMNKYLSGAIKTWYPNGFDFNAIGLANYTVDVAKTGAIWAVGLALIVGIIAAVLFDYQRVVSQFKEGVNASIGGSLLAVMNTASEYGFGAIIAALPGFALISHALSNTFTNPLVNGAITTTTRPGLPDQHRAV